MAKLNKKTKKEIYIPDGKGMWEVKTEMKRGFLYITSAPITILSRSVCVVCVCVRICVVCVCICVVCAKGEGGRE